MEQIKKLADGRIYTGDQAKRRGWLMRSAIWKKPLKRPRRKRD